MLYKNQSVTNETGTIIVMIEPHKMSFSACEQVGRYKR
jgi:hypothetical protein